MIRVRGCFLKLVLTALALQAGSEEMPGWEQIGTASWYGGIFQGRQTANGEIYDTYGYTCAHKSLPFGTVLEVTNLENMRSVTVRVNDRGPFVDDRIIDLTYAAAKDLDMIRDGTAEVRLSAAKESIPDVRFTVQVGAWADPENAVGHKRRLAGAGLTPSASLADSGVTRIAIQGVSEEAVFETVTLLEEMGYSDLFVYQASGDR